MGLDVMRAAYAEAIRENYRFYSYGDACLLIRPA
jgi:S-adenosylmethionine:tRNA ribosyltransferase-isomerase